MKEKLLKFQNLFFHYVLTRNLKNCITILDVGCGYSSPIGSIKNGFKSEGIDLHKKTLDLARKNKTHDKYKLGDVRKLSNYYKSNSFDACVSVDVIEHLAKGESKKMIKEMEKIAKKRVIILTPNGFYEQHEEDGNPHMEHKSGWSKKDLESLGYKVYGLRGFKNLRDDHATIKYKPWIFWGTVAFISEIILYFAPQQSFDLFAVKYLD